MRQPNLRLTWNPPRTRPRRYAPALAALLVATLALPPSRLLAGRADTPRIARAQAATVANPAYPEPGTYGARTILNNNRVITPVGKETVLGDLPVNAVLSPDGAHLLVVNSGAGVQSLQVVNTADSSVQQTLPYYSDTAPNSVFVGAAYNPGGTHAYASGGGSNVIHTYDVAPSGQLSATADISDGATGSLYPNISGPVPGPYPAGLSVSPDGNTLYVANNLANTVSIFNTTNNTLATTVTVGQLPYTTLATPDGKKVYVSNWGGNSVSVIDAGARAVVKTIPVGVANTVAAATSHPSAMALSPDGLLFVSLSNSDAIAVIDTATDTVARTLSVAPYYKAPLSSSPQGLAVSPNGQYLYVADAGTDEVSVFALNGHGGPERKIGRIPTAWYPTAVAVSADNGTLFVTNAKGHGTGPNGNPQNLTGTPLSAYPDPARLAPPGVVSGLNGSVGYCNCTFDKFTASMIAGTLSIIPVPSPGRLRIDTFRVAINNHERPFSFLPNVRTPGNPIPISPGGATPIKHIIYLLKENRTYDQVFGDEAIGDSDPSLALFPRAVTPNIHALADHYGLFDNFYADAEVSADGHNWSLSANASDYNEKTWPQDYSAGKGRNRNYDYESGSAINLSPGGYLWDAAAAAGVSYRDYGLFLPFNTQTFITQTVGTACDGPVATHTYGPVFKSGAPAFYITPPQGQELCFLPEQVSPNTPNLAGHVDAKYRNYDLSYREADRVAEWQHEFNAYTANGQGNLPGLEFLRLANDHMMGTRAGAPTPQAYAAENDAAVGQIVDTVSHSAVWGSTAIFVVEDDAQNGPDHVDAHRTEALVISPYTYHATPFVDHSLYDTAAMLRTMELILGLQPLSQFDAEAIPMWRDFNRTPDTTPYAAVPASLPATTVNTAATYGALESAQMDFSREDRAPADRLNRILWHAIKGITTPYPVIHDRGGVRTGADPD